MKDILTDPIYLSMIGAGILALGVLCIVIMKRRPESLDQAYYRTEWKTIEKKLRNKDLWALAIIDADKLLDRALKARRYKGKSMGERLVAAQRDLSSNNTVWFAHKLRNKLVHEESPKLAKDDVKEALIGLRQALKDIGALQ